jgi:hypothetical protein
MKYDLSHIRSTPGMGWLLFIGLTVCIVAFVIVSCAG